MNSPVSNDVAYRQVRANITRLLADRPAGDVTVPACPEWTVRDLLVHLVYVSGRMVGRLTGAPVPPPPADDLGVAALLAEWETRSQRTDQVLAEFGADRTTIGVMDAFTHELDLRCALGSPPPAGHPALPRSLELIISGLSTSVTDRGLPAMCLRAGDGRWVAGQGEPVVTVSGDPLELYRSLAGRRTHEQIAALTWTADPRQWLPAFEWGPFHPPRTPVEQARA